MILVYYTLTPNNILLSLSKSVIRSECGCIEMYVWSLYVITTVNFLPYCYGALKNILNKNFSLTTNFYIEELLSVFFSLKEVKFG